MATDSIERVPYRIGYSFRNPDVVKRVTKIKSPYWKMTFSGRGPTQIKEDMWKSGRMKDYPSVWRRSAKANTVKGLGDVEEFGTELPSFYELGQVPITTEKSSEAVVRSPFGQLLNVALTGIQTVVEEESKLQQIKSGAMPQSRSGLPYFSQEFGGMTGMTTIGLALVVGLGVYLFIRK